MSYFHLGAESDLLERPANAASAGNTASGLRVVELERMCHDAAVSKAAFRAQTALTDNDFIRWSAARWDEPVIAVMDGDRCVAGLNWSIDEKERYASVDFAFCAEDSPRALAVCLLRARKKVAEAKLDQVRFSCHSGNEPMQKLVRKLGLVPHSMSFRVPVKRAA